MKRKPKVNYNRSHSKVITLIEDELIGSYSLKEFISKLETLAEDTCIDVNWAGYDGGVEVEIYQLTYLESEEEYNQRVEAEEKSLKDWENERQALLEQDLEKRRIENIKILEDQLRILKGDEL